MSVYHSSAEISDREATETALKAFSTAWKSIRQIWKKPPPQYAEDPDFRDQLAGVAAVAEQASYLTGKNQLPEANAALQQIPAMMADMRRRNGLSNFTDEMDSFRELLAEINDDTFNQFELTPPEVVDMLKTIGALSYIRERIEKRAPAALVENDDFLDNIGELNAHLQKLTAAVLAGRRTPILAALRDLRHSFQKAYLLYG